MACAQKDDVRLHSKGYAGKEVIKLPWFAKYDKDKIKQSTLLASEIVQKFGREGDLSSGIIQLTSKYELTEVESKELLEAVREKLWNSLGSGENIASEEVRLEDDDIQYTERVVQIKNREYKLGPILGKGGFGVVRLGGHPTNPHKKYALKFISKKHMKNNIHFVKREIKCMKSITHTNVLRLYRYGNVEYPHEDGNMDPSMLLVTEYCPNGELFDIIFYCQSGMSETLTRTYFHQLMEGIKAIHEQDVFHRDIKPQNLLLDSHFELKICDFGLSNVWNKVDLLKTKVGTRGFMAPEMMMKFNYNSAVDIFSAGVVLFNMITGVCPFRNADPNTDVHYYRVATKDARFWKNHQHLGQGIRDLIEGMLAYQPADRYTQENIEENEWYKGEVHDSAGLEHEMRELHKQCILKKGEDNSNVDITSYVYRDFPEMPLLAQADRAKYLTNFHTYQITKGMKEDCLSTLYKCLMDSVENAERDVISSAGRDVYTAKYVKKVRQHKEDGEEDISVKTEKHEVIIQVRVFRLSKESDSPIYFTIFRQGDRDYSKEFLTKLNPVHSFCTHYRGDLASTIEYDSEDDFEDDSGFDEEAAEAFAEKLYAEENEMGEN